MFARAITVLCSILVLLIGPSLPVSAAAMSRQAFEKLLMEKAVPESLATDHLGAWINIWQHILMARALDRKMYERGLIQLNPEHCNNVKILTTRLSCVANIAADAASKITAFAAAVEFRRDAVSYAEQVSNQDPEPLLETLIDLAFDEQLHGGLAEAERAFERASALLAAHARLANPHRRFRLAILRARLADARLDDATAGGAFAEAVEVAIRSRSKGPTGKFPSMQEAFKTDPLDDLMKQHLRGRFCPSCGTTAADAAKQWIKAVLTGRAQVDIGFEPPEGDHLLMALSAPPGTFTTAELKSFSSRYLTLKSQNERRQFVSRERPEREIAQHLALSNLILDVGTTDGNLAKVLALLRAPDGRVYDSTLRKFLTEMIEGGFEQFGSDSAIAAYLDDLARKFQTFGLRWQARTTLQVLRDRTSGANVIKERAKLATVYAPSLAQLASLHLAASDRAAALRDLDAASALAAGKLREEWTSGGAGAILALRDLAPTLRLIAQKRAEIVAPAGLSRNGPGHDVLFRELQTTLFGETALTLEVANQRRVLADETTGDLRRRYLDAAAEVERTTEIAGYVFESGDVGGALAAARRATVARQDTLARALREHLPNLTVADIAPVPLAEARSRLRGGEALILLHVGSDALHGFLLDASGQSYAWRTSVRPEALEGLVRTLRAAGDVADGLPLFPAADATKLYSLIFGPVRDKLGEYGKLILVGDGPLQAMPYGLLLTRSAEAPASADAHRAASLPWLVRTHALALLPSVRTLVAQRSEAVASRAAKPFLGIGDPSFNASGTQTADGSGALRSIDVAKAFQGGTGLADVTQLSRLVGLPETADELRAIATALNAPPDALMLGAGATERAVRASPLADYRIVAFATHGALAGEVTGTSEPGLVLTPPATASREDDGFLALSEITGLRFDADLVMLSACNTATSDGRPRAEGLSGLARGFFGAGARSLLATHWAIPSESSVKVTTGLIAHRAEHPEADWAEALRAATLAVIDREGPSEWAHPAFWAGFAAIGVLPATR